MVKPENELEPFLAIDSDHHPSHRTPQQWKSRFLTILIYPFLLGTIASSPIWTIPVVALSLKRPCSQSLSGAKTDCGTTPVEARSRGCHFQLWSYSWVPHDCFDSELQQDFLKLQETATWKYYRNASALEADKVPLTEVLMGEGDGLYSTWGQHYWHCAYYLRRFFRATGGITNRNRDSHHSIHCQQWLASPFEYDWGAVNIHLRVGYHECDSTWLTLGVLDKEMLTSVRL